MVAGRFGCELLSFPGFEPCQGLRPAKILGRNIQRSLRKTGRRGQDVALDGFRPNQPLAGVQKTPVMFNAQAVIQAWLADFRELQRKVEQRQSVLVAFMFSVLKHLYHAGA